MTPKFRVWDGEEMHYPHEEGLLSLVFENGGWKLIRSRESVAAELITYSSASDSALMRHTGLTDAEGTQVWEGDVIIDVNDQKIVGNNLNEAVWGNVKFGHHSGSLDGRSTDGLGFYWTTPYIENTFHLIAPKSWLVIGNTYENPELLEQNATPA